MPTLKDIARATGYSVGAVSQLLNTDDPRYTEKTRKAVREVAEKMGYRPHHQAQTLKRGRSGLIGVVSFLSGQKGLTKLGHIFDALETHPKAGNRRFLVNTLVTTPERARAVIDTLIDLRVDALVAHGFPPWAPPELLRTLENAPFPVLGIDGVRIPGAPRVRIDRSGGMRALTRRVLESGYRDLVLLPGGHRRPGKWKQPDSSHPGALIEGFRNAVDEFGADRVRAEIRQQNSETARERPHAKPAKDYQDGYATLQALLKARSRPEIVLCHDDEWAIGAMAACRGLGIRIPEDLAFTGFDDTGAGRFSSVPLTTVAQPLAEMAGTAADTLFALLEKGENQPSRNEDIVITPCSVIVRESCRSTTVETTAEHEAGSPPPDPDLVLNEIGAPASGSP